MFAAALPAAAALGASAMEYFGQKQTNEANRDIARETNVFSAKQAELNRQFQERMSSTAYQRARKDLEAAGYNPILAVGQGGASSPAGSSAAGTTGAPMQNPFARVSTSAIAALKAHEELKNLQETNSNIAANTKKLGTDAELNQALTRSAQFDAQVKSNTARSTAAQARILESQLPGAKTEADIDSSRYGRVLRFLGRLNPFSSSAAALAKFVK